MQLHPNSIFHLYNRGNNRQPIFFRDSNYRFFLKKVRQKLTPYSDIFAYCLMPNHFHFMISTEDNFNKDGFVKNYRIILSSYTRAINLQEGRTGSLFQQKSKTKEIQSDEYALICLNYIHQNPVKAGLVEQMGDWEYSSFKDYTAMRKNGISKCEKAIELLDLPNSASFQNFSESILPENYYESIF